MSGRRKKKKIYLRSPILSTIPCYMKILSAEKSRIISLLNKFGYDYSRPCYSVLLTLVQCTKLDSIRYSQTAMQVSPYNPYKRVGH